MLTKIAAKCWRSLQAVLLPGPGSGSHTTAPKASCQPTTKGVRARNGRVPTLTPEPKQGSLHLPPLHRSNANAARAAGCVLHPPGSTTPRNQLPQHAGRFFSLLVSVSGETTILTPSPGLVGLSSDANACK